MVTLNQRCWRKFLICYGNMGIMADTAPLTLIWAISFITPIMCEATIIIETPFPPSWSSVATVLVNSH